MGICFILGSHWMLLGCKASYSFYPRHLRVSRDGRMSKMMTASSNKGFPDTRMLSDLCDIALSVLNFIDKLTNGLEFLSQVITQRLCRYHHPVLVNDSILLAIAFGCFGIEG